MFCWQLSLIFIFYFCCDKVPLCKKKSHTKLYIKDNVVIQNIGLNYIWNGT